MFEFLKKKQADEQLYAAVGGTLHALEESEEEVFAAKMMGEGFFIRPSSNTLYAPIDGKVASIFPTKHAFTIESHQGSNLLIHIGIDTVELAGAPFQLELAAGQKLTAGEKIGQIDFAAIEKAGKKTDIFVLFPDIGEPEKIAITLGEAVQGGSAIGKLQ